MTTENFQSMVDELLKGLPDIGTDIRQYLSAELHKRLRELNLVTRDEFDIQTKVLARSREKIEQLEKQIAALETQLKIKP